MPSLLRSPASVVVLVAAVATVAVALLAIAWLSMPAADITLLALYLTVSACVSLGVSIVAYRFSEARKRSIQTKLLLAHLLGAFVLVANILVTARLMFISSHDLGLLLILLAFSALCSLAFGSAVARRLTGAVAHLSEGARRVSTGDWTTRVEVGTNDELTELADSFNDMVGRVNATNDAREKAERARRELVIAISHDLRTPLTAMRAMLEAMSDGLVSDPATIARYHDVMRGQVDLLSRQIDDLFELSHIDSGQIPFDFRDGNLGAVVRDAVEGIAMSAARRGVRVSVCGEDALPVRIDPVRFSRVIQNLLDNALQHAPRDSEIRVSLARTQESAILTVRDHGDGIEAADLPHVFERFFRGERSRSRERGGTGLGLAIAQAIVVAHGGTIEAGNATGGGAEFIVRLPVRWSDQ
ncbi:MAG: hypothetical protein DCC58_03530 [Chloroflexi bacterium]|nr:MAG: hypothetical protein DCC58_03530 [Chloroflexota bacterium]